MTKALRLEETCPKCGSHLMIREGEDGDFLACPRFPVCRFTKPLPDNDLKIYQKPSPYCEKCNHTGLIPFKNKEGKVIPHTFLHCDCHEINQPEQGQPIRLMPEDYDFPMSYSYYRSLCQYHGWSDPGPCEPAEHDLEELHDRILALEERPQPTAKLGDASPKPQQKPEPRLHGGVSL